MTLERFFGSPNPIVTQVRLVIFSSLTTAKMLHRNAGFSPLYPFKRVHSAVRRLRTSLDAAPDIARKHELSI